MHKAKLSLQIILFLQKAANVTLKTKESEKYFFKATYEIETGEDLRPDLGSWMIRKLVM